MWLKGKPDNLEIATFHSFALKQYSKSYQRVTPVFGDANLKEEKQTVLSDKNEAYTKLSLTDEQIWSELEYINDYLIKDKEEYLEFDRQGRGFSLQKVNENIFGCYMLIFVLSCRRLRNTYRVYTLRKSRYQINLLNSLITYCLMRLNSSRHLGYS